MTWELTHPSKVHIMAGITNSVENTATLPKTQRRVLLVEIYRWRWGGINFIKGYTKNHRRTIEVTINVEIR